MSDTLLFDASVKKKKTKKVDNVDAVTDMMAELGAKKKKKSTNNESLEDAGGLEGEFDFGAKKKKSKSQGTAADDFEAALKKAGVAEDTPEDEEDAEAENQTKYESLLDRFFDILREKNPEMAGDRNVKYKIPPPIVTRDGNKKVLFANIQQIAEKMRRPTEHVIQYLFAELGTSGSVDGTGRLVIKGRFQQKQIEGVIRRYILEYVTCKTCKLVNTTLRKENRLYFLDCNSCGSRRSVQSIKTGYQVVTRRSRRQKTA